ncbi:helix-turn-helix domain-containing protein [Paenibacillus sp. NPDC056579]|uniref:AraC family transcriptional regulator n=1 Tax=Paenibacillus sp. NPDC056579 TaxID=3345871 RepID=UPI0036AE8716
MKTSTVDLSELRSRILSANFYPFKPGQLVGPRLPYVHLFVYIPAGKGRVAIGEQSWAAEQGDLFYIAPGVTHTFAADPHDPMVHASVYVDLLSPSTPKLKGDGKLNCYYASEYELQLCAAKVDFSEGITIPVQIRVPHNVSWMESFLTVIETYPEQSLGNDLLLRAHFESFLIRYIQYSLKPQNSHDPRIEKMIESLELADSANAGVTEWAQRFGISTAYLYELFRKQTGTSPQNYLLQCKLDKAKAYLRETNMPVTEIAYKLGFSSLHYFARQFSKYVQEPASKYRQRFRGFG